MLNWITDNVLPLAVGFLLPVAALLLRAGAKGLRAYVKGTPSKADDALAKPVADALDGAADAIHPGEPKR